MTKSKKTDSAAVASGKEKKAVKPKKASVKKEKSPTVEKSSTIAWSDKLIEVTESANAHFEKVVSVQNAMGIRVSLKKGGCTGYSYVVEACKVPATKDMVFRPYNVSIFVPEEDMVYLKGTKFDYVKEGLNEHLKILNPNEKSACGCGVSVGFD